jgi:RNA polymerase sigma factor (sigma-70 family)
VNQDSQTDVKSEHVVDPEVWVDDHGDVLYRFALARLRNSATAEDLVQETLLAAFKAKDRFEGRASVRSWLVGILKNKIIDFFRKRSRETSFSDLEFMRGELGDRMKASALMGEHWIAEQGPREWASPEDGQAAGQDRGRVFDARGRWGGVRGNLRGFQHQSEQLLGHASSGAVGAAAVPGAELVSGARNDRRRAMKFLQKFMSGIMPSCSEASRLASRSLDEKLPASRRFALWLHQRMCGLCRRYGSQLNFMRDAAAELEEKQPPSAFVRFRPQSSQGIAQLRGERGQIGSVLAAVGRLSFLIILIPAHSSLLQYYRHLGSLTKSARSFDLKNRIFRCRRIGR